MDDRRRAFIGEQKIELVYASSKWPTPDLGYSSLQRLISNHLYATVTDPPLDTIEEQANFAVEGSSALTESL